MDSNVLEAQRYLNAMFGGHPNWEQLDEDGNTGTVTLEGIIRAFQIQNNVTSITGTVGPLTIAAMKRVPIIKKMDPDDISNINVCIIQCALFCKGYNAGGITGIYYNAGVAAIKERHSEAGIPVTGEIGWKVWAGLLSLNWFKIVQGGNGTIQLIQRQLNSDWSDVIGVGPCDGVMSRQTALSLIGALQAAEGVTTDLITDLNEVNFGNATTDNFPSVLKNGKNGSGDIPYNKIIQYALYFNGYNPARYDGIFDYQTEVCVTEFQNFYALTGIGLVTAGEVNVSTMKSLLVSKGDTDRSARACDCATVLNRQQAFDLKNAGFTHVGRYLTGSVGNEFIPKYITKEEAGYIEDVGLSVFPIYQDGGYYLEYFQEAKRGAFDAEIAVKAAESIGIPAGTTIYFAVDFDCLGTQVEELIIPYFRRLNWYFNSNMNTKNYKVGIYAPRYVCTLVSSEGLASYSFVADMSTGFSGNLGFPLPANWAYDQFYEKSFASVPSFPIDKVAYSGRDTGMSSFDEVTDKNEEEICKEKLDEAERRFLYEIAEKFGFLDKVLEIGVSYGVKEQLATIDLYTCVINIYLTAKVRAYKPADSDFSIGINVNQDGELTETCKTALLNLGGKINIPNVGGDKIQNLLTDMALTVKAGNISFSIREVSAIHSEYAVIISSDKIEAPDCPLASTFSMEFLFTISSKDPNAIFFDKEYAVAYLVGVGIGVVALGSAVVVSAAIGSAGVTGLTGALTTIGEGILSFLRGLGVAVAVPS